MSGTEPHAFDLAIKIVGLFSSIGLVFTWVWIISRKWQGVDRGNQAWLQLNGDKESKTLDERTGLIDEHKQTRKITEEALARARAIQDGLGAYGSRADIIAANVRKSFAELAREAAEARANRQRVLEAQNEAFANDRTSDSFVEAPRLPPRDPRREDDDRPFRPEDTGRFGGRKKR